MKIFIAGPRAVTKLHPLVIKKLKDIADKNYTVLVGDANGVDRTIQEYFKNSGHNNIIVYASGEKVRNNIGNWETRNIMVSDNVKGFDFYVMKDKEMAKESDYGFMIWNGKSKGTFNNITNLLSYGKTVVLYFIPSKRFYIFKTINELEKFINKIDNKEINKFFIMNQKTNEQLKFI